MSDYRHEQKLKALAISTFGLHAAIMQNGEDALFLYTKEEWVKDHFMFPITAHCE
ncbi:hypothetical protein ACQCU3_11265 [Bacillus altitudinis]|uniref:hypothetical protein n=1 Tax=Bacillus altitudinis TaxID=293387 RepID=UPI001653E391|nr:hypothetical protein [Bacillus altitudinis]